MKTNFNEILKNVSLDNMIVKVYVYDNELKCVINPNQYDLILVKDFDDYVKQHKSRLYDTQFFVKSNI